MKEVFAGFMASKIVNPSYPKINHDLLFLANHYPSAYAEDRTQGTNPIRQQLANLKDAGSLYGSIIYDKAPIMMRQLETAMGEKAFQKGIQRYIATFAQKSANWNDLVSILDQETPLDLADWSSVWVNQSGRPILSEKLSYAPDGKIASFALSQRAEDGSTKVWPQLFDITLIYADRLHTIPVSMQGQSVEIQELVGLPKPISILYNSNGLGYGVFPFDLKSADVLISHPNEVMRGHFYINVYENTLAGNIATSSAFEIFRRGILAENNEILVQLISGQLSSIFWKFLAAEDRLANLDRLEKELWQRLQTDLPLQLKKSLFGLYSSIAYSESGQNQLYQIWKKEIELENLKLNPDNFTSLAMSLAVYGHPAAEEILTEERARITNSDKLARFDFLRPALSQDPAVRDSVFLSFKKASNREKESWVLTACDYLHHPLHQETSIRQVGLALEWMEEIQKTGDIFFPKRWASSTIGQYNSPEAARIAEDFLASRPDFNPILKNKILQSIDNLMRAQTLIK
jgi:aminopeptidase N